MPSPRKTSVQSEEVAKIHTNKSRLRFKSFQLIALHWLIKLSCIFISLTQSGHSLLIAPGRRRYKGTLRFLGPKTTASHTFLTDAGH